MVEIKIGEDVPEEWVVSGERADPVPPHVFEQVLDEVCARVREDHLEIRRNYLDPPVRAAYLRS